MGLPNLTLLAQLPDRCKQAAPEQRHFQTSCLDLLLRNTCCTHEALGYRTASGENSGPPFNPIQSGREICESQHPDHTSPFQAAPACSCDSGWQNPIFIFIWMSFLIFTSSDACTLFLSLQILQPQGPSPFSAKIMPELSSQFLRKESPGPFTSQGSD